LEKIGECGVAVPAVLPLAAIWFWVRRGEVAGLLEPVKRRRPLSPRLRPLRPPLWSAVSGH